MGGSEQTVLVVDDDPSIRLLCRVNLELEGYRVLEAERLGEAEEALRAEPVDVVLLDVHVGTDNSLERLAALRAVRPTAKVALLTGTSEADPPALDGVNAVIQKPFSLNRLITAVNSLAGEAANAVL
jgi:DNA-binding NtrC family response regulator